MENLDKYIEIVLEEVEKAFNENEVPVGAVLLDENNNLVSRAHNLKEKNKDVTSHAEIVCLKEASNIKNDYHLNNYTLIVSLMPCLMCLSAIVDSKISKVIYLAKDPDLSISEITLRQDFAFEHKVELIYKENIKVKEILQNFFKNKRN